MTEKKPNGDKLKEAMVMVDKAEAEPYIPPIIDYDQFGRDVDASLGGKAMTGQELADHTMEGLRRMKAQLEEKEAALTDDIKTLQDKLEAIGEEREAVRGMLASLRTIV